MIPNRTLKIAIAIIVAIFILTFIVHPEMLTSPDKILKALLGAIFTFFICVGLAPKKQK